MTHDEAEFLMSQQLDGTLDAAETRRLHSAIDADAMLAAMWREHQALDAALHASRVAADDSSELLVASIAAQIDEEPERTLKIASWNWRMPLAAAATLAVGLTIGALSMRGNSHGTGEMTIAKTTAKTTPSVTEFVAAPIPVVASRGTDSTDSLPTRGGYANVSVGIPANLTPSIVASLYVAERFPRDRVVIEAAGHRESGAFE